MRPGITLQHSKEVVRRQVLIRSDVTGFIGVIPPRGWPEEAHRGDFLEIAVEGPGALDRIAAAGVFDQITIRAVEQFFDNGGQRCVIFGVCMRSERDLCRKDTYGSIWRPLLHRLAGAEDIGILAIPVLAYMDVEYDERGRAVVPYEPTLEAMLEHCGVQNPGDCAGCRCAFEGCCAV